MNQFVIEGGKRLQGEVIIKGAKNSVLPMLAASILTNEEIKIENCPELSDTFIMLKILKELGADAEYKDGTAYISSPFLTQNEIPQNLARELRSSIFLLGPMLGRSRFAKAVHPGGCAIGLRPIDLHIKGLKALNVDIEEENGFIICDAKNMRGGEVFFDFPSVGATENVIMAAVLASGTTVIRGAAKEPEIEDLSGLLIKMGAKIKGAGSSIIEIEGVERLHGASYRVMPDRIVAGTYMLATAICEGKVAIIGAEKKHLTSLISKLDKNCCQITDKDGILLIVSEGRHQASEMIETMPYPGFPTDLQAPMMSLSSVSSGATMFHETIFETRFKHVPELTKMGAKISVRGKTAFVWGTLSLKGTTVYAPDLRGGAALVLAGLKAEGETVVRDIFHIERGYADLDKDFTKLGARIKKT